MNIKLSRDIAGSILDIGGGGECVIGQVFGDAVIAVDISQEELDEAPDCCKKQLMDARDLRFPDGSFDNVTFFYALMYMSRDTQRQAIAEAARVLRPGGMIHIWDADIRSACPEPFIVDLDIAAGRKTIRVSYGIVKDEAQDSDAILRHLEAAGLSPARASVSKQNGQFFIRATKE